MLIFDEATSKLSFFIFFYFKLGCPGEEQSSPPLVSYTGSEETDKEYNLSLINTLFDTLAASVTFDTELYVWDHLYFWDHRSKKYSEKDDTMNDYKIFLLWLLYRTAYHVVLENVSKTKGEMMEVNHAR